MTTLNPGEALQRLNGALFEHPNFEEGAHFTAITPLGITWFDPRDHRAQWQDVPSISSSSMSQVFLEVIEAFREEFQLEWLESN